MISRLKHHAKSVSTQYREQYRDNHLDGSRIGLYHDIHDIPTALRRGMKNNGAWRSPRAPDHEKPPCCIPREILREKGE